jgi:type IV pilus assembly protein PilV
MKGKTFNKNNGFSLLEFLVGLLILAIGILAIAGLQITSIRGNYFSNNLTRATTLGQDKLEYLNNLSYDHTDLSSGHHDEGTVSGTIFSRQYAVTEVGDSMKKITVVVKWTDKFDHSISLSTIRSK